MIALIVMAGKLTLFKKDGNFDRFIDDESLSESTETFESHLQSNR